MRAAVRTLSLVLSLLVAFPALAHGDARAAEQVDALLEVVKQVTRKAEPAIVAVLVSRSEEYHTARYWGEPAQEEDAGKLGKFDAVAALARVPADVRHRARIEAAIRNHDLSDPSTVPESYGSGFVVGPGLVLTNSHVVKNATRVYVRLPGVRRGSWADIHASDPRSDLAVLRLLDKVPEVTPLKLGKAENVTKGQVLVSLINAWSPTFRGHEVTSTWGVVTGLNRRPPGVTNEAERSKVPLHHYGTLIQTDARIIAGCSGGVQLDLDGEVVGLTTALAAIGDEKRSGVLAVPFNASTRRIAEVLLRGEEVEYGFLGVQLSDRPQRGMMGVQINRVSPGSPAARAGLMMGDMIVAINDQPVRETDDLFLHIGMGLAGHSNRVTFVRTRQPPRTVDVKLAKFYVPGPVIAAHRPPARGGLRVDYTSILAQRGPFQGWVRPPPDGVVIREVIPNSSADKANLQPDKVITQVNGKPVTSPAEYYREMGKAGATAELTILNSENRPEQVDLDLK